MLVVLLALAVLLMNREWKAIPLLTIGFLIYAVAGWYELDLFWWYFRLDPYLYVKPMAYGSGTWYHFLDSNSLHTGVLTMILLPIGFLGIPGFRKKKRNPKRCLYDTARPRCLFRCLICS